MNTLCVAQAVKLVLAGLAVGLLIHIMLGGYGAKISRMIEEPGSKIVREEKLMNQESEDSPLTELKYAGDFMQIQPEECVETPEFYGGVKSTVCVMPGEDYIQKNLKKKGAFEPEVTNAVVKAMAVYSGATFVDCGSNIGMMSTVVAAMGRSVVSLDPMVMHLTYLRRSLELAGNQNHVRLLNNAVSDTHGILYPGLAASSGTNTAAIRLYSEQALKQANLKAQGPPVKVVTVMDILATIETSTVILKVDVESMECKAVTTEVAHGESGHYIPFIVIEWTMLPEAPHYAECVGWLFDGGYKPYHMVNYTEFTKKEVLGIRKNNHKHYEMGNEYHDIIWLHNTTDPMELKP